MSKKKGLFNSLFGAKKQTNCCNIEIVEEPENNSNSQKQKTKSANSSKK